MATLSSLLRSSARVNIAVASGIALSAYALHSRAPVRALEPAEEHIFVINGFYMAMREKYTKPGESIYYYLVEWEPSKLSWEGFRGKVLGATDPSTAENGALRKAIYSNWKELGLKSEPNVGDNGVHASASPFEALAERLNWMGVTLEEDSFGKALLDSGIPKDTILAWTKDPQVPFDGKKASLFDLFEDLDYDDCLAKAQIIAGVSGKRPSGKMQAFVFIKPHAVTEPTKKLVSNKFAEASITIVKQGSLTAEAIEKGKLIDNHYYAIANKVRALFLQVALTRHALPPPPGRSRPMFTRTQASLSKPAELNPPAKGQEEFAKKFGITWKAALEKGVVYNAVDGCKRLGVDGVVMDKTWVTLFSPPLHHPCDRLPRGYAPR